jgi:hypothetical protein
MMNREKTLYAQSQFRELIGINIIDAFNSFGSSLFIYFDKEVQGQNEGKKNNWHLWVEFSHWHFLKSGDLYIGEGDDMKEINAKIKALIGSHITSIQLTHPYKLSIHFSNQWELRTFPMGTNEAYWHLFINDSIISIENGD